MRHILIIEDDRRIARNVGRSLADEGYITEVAYDGMSGRDRALANDFDLVLLDINLPVINGLTVLRMLRAQKPQLPVIMLTAFGEVEDRVDGLTAGADDYVVKPFDIRELLARVGSCLRRLDHRRTDLPDEVLRVADLSLNQTTKRVTRQDTPISLTGKEFALLSYLMQHYGQVVSKMELNKHIWHFDFDPGTNVVEVYINYLRKKIDRDFSPRLIHTRPGLGYVLTEEPL